MWRQHDILLRMIGVASVAWLAGTVMITNFECGPLPMSTQSPSTAMGKQCLSTVMSLTATEATAALLNIMLVGIACYEVKRRKWQRQDRVEAEAALMVGW